MDLWFFKPYLMFAIRLLGCMQSSFTSNQVGYSRCAPMYEKCRHLREIDKNIL